MFINKYYYCYSYNQKKYLLENGEFCIIKGIHPVTQKKYWVFERNEKLNKLLDKWQSNKK